MPLPQSVVQVGGFMGADRWVGIVSSRRRGTGCDLDMKPPSGIGGMDPRKHASPKVGRRNVELAAAAIGHKAQELLASLPENQRSSNLKGVSPQHWWMV